MHEKYLICLFLTHIVDRPKVNLYTFELWLVVGEEVDEEDDGFAHPLLGLNLCSYHKPQVPSSLPFLISSKNQNRQCAIHSYVVNAASCLIEVSSTEANVVDSPIATSMHDGAPQSILLTYR